MESRSVQASDLLISMFLLPFRQNPGYFFSGFNSHNTFTIFHSPHVGDPFIKLFDIQYDFCFILGAGETKKAGNVFYLPCAKIEDRPGYFFPLGRVNLFSSKVTFCSMVEKWWVEQSLGSTAAIRTVYGIFTPSTSR